MRKNCSCDFVIEEKREKPWFLIVINETRFLELKKCKLFDARQQAFVDIQSPRCPARVELGLLRIRECESSKMIFMIFVNSTAKETVSLVEFLARKRRRTNKRLLCVSVKFFFRTLLCFGFMIDNQPVTGWFDSIR